VESCGKLLRPPLIACPICFQVEPGATTAGLEAGVLVLVAVTAGVLTCFAVFAARFIRRS
jgi:hypothetical protein